MAPDTGITIGEVYRTVVEVVRRLDHVIGRPEYEADRRAIADRLRDLEQDNARLEQRIGDAEKQRQADDQRTQTQGLQVRLALLGAVVGPVVVAVFMLFMNSYLGAGK